MQAPSSADPPKRKPDAVVLEPPGAMPVAASRAEARGVVALREPLGSDAVHDVVAALVDAYQRGSIEALTALLTLDAGPIEARARGRPALVEAWQKRLKAHEYARFAGVDLVRFDRVEHWDYGDLSAPSAPARPPGMRTDEVFVRAPVEVTHLSGDRVFGDAIVLLLRREGGSYRIVAYGEIDAP